MRSIIRYNGLDRGMPLLERSRILLHPVFVLSLLLLILNDHYFKLAAPSFLTGKLSDISGLIVFPIVVYVLIGDAEAPRWGLWAQSSAIVLTFVIWKLAPIERITELIGAATSLPMPVRVKDASDLWALPSVALSHLLVRRYQEHRTYLCYSSSFARVTAVCLLCLSLGAIMATSYTHHSKVGPIKITPDSAVLPPNTKARVLNALERSLWNEAFEVTSRDQQHETSFTIGFRGPIIEQSGVVAVYSHEQQADSFFAIRRGRNNGTTTNLALDWPFSSGTLQIQLDPHSRVWEATLEVWMSNWSIPDRSLDTFFHERIIAPVKRELGILIEKPTN